MKTYRDLTDEELKRLHLIVCPFHAKKDVLVDRSELNDGYPNPVILTRPSIGYTVTWWVDSGSMEIDAPETTIDLYGLVRAGKELGLTY